MRALTGLLAMLTVCAHPAVAQDDQDGRGSRPTQPIGLMGTVPLYWGEAAGIDELLDGEARPHWARPVIAEAGEPVPLDFLTADALDHFGQLVLAQPRALAGEENVALDAWVRAGGSLLLFADPLMTGKSRFGLGDRRRPQDVALLSPILSHWGLELHFDLAQPDGLQMREFAGSAVPVAMAGTLLPLGEPDGSPACTMEAGGLVARCALGAGHALIVADAAVLDIAGPYPGAESGLRALLRASFGDFLHAGESHSEDVLANTGIYSETTEDQRRQQDQRHH